MGTGWLKSEVSDVHQDAKTDLRIVDELILGLPLGWTDFGLNTCWPVGYKLTHR